MNANKKADVCSVMSVISFVLYMATVYKGWSLVNPLILVVLGSEMLVVWYVWKSIFEEIRAHEGA